MHQCFVCATLNKHPNDSKESVYTSSVASSQNILVCAAWPYANGPRHLGHISGFAVPSDIFARYCRSIGKDVLFVSGTDEHGTPVALEAQKLGLTAKQFADDNNALIREDLCDLNISYDLFTSTTTKLHAKTVQEIFGLLLQQNLVFAKAEPCAFDQSGKPLPDRYVAGICPFCGQGATADQCDHCGRQLTVSELLAAKATTDGQAPVVRDSEHLFLDLPALAEQLQKFLSDKEHWRSKVVSIASALVQDLRSRSITRDLQWGVSVDYPGFEDKCFYVWFEAVIGYLSASIQWANEQGDSELWRQWWENPQAHHAYFLGKDNIVFHTIIWPAILAGVNGQRDIALKLPDQVAASEFLLSGTDKFSSSRKTAVYVQQALQRVSPDALRYYLTAGGPQNNDTSFSWQTLCDKVNNELAANFGNLAQRTLSIVHKNYGCVPAAGTLTENDQRLLDASLQTFDVVGGYIERCEFKEALQACIELSRKTNVYFTDQAPWTLIKAGDVRADTVLHVTLQILSDLKVLLTPFLPDICQRLHVQLGFEGQWSDQVTNNDNRTLTVSRGSAVWQRQWIVTGQNIDAPRALIARVANPEEQPPQIDGIQKTLTSTVHN